MDTPPAVSTSETRPAPLRALQPTARAQSKQVRRTRLRSLRQLLLWLLLAGAAVGSVFALRPARIPVDVARVARGPLVVAIEESGMTRVKDRYLVAAPVSGSLARVTLEPGDTVREGDALAEIAPAVSALLDARTRAEAEGRLGAALSALGQARAQEARALSAKQLSAQELARVSKLRELGSATEQAFEQAQFLDRMRQSELASALFASKVANEEVRIARVALGQNSQISMQRHVDVLAPASGRVLQVQQKSAGPVLSGAPLLEVGDPEALEVVVDLLTTDAVQIVPGSEVVIEGWGKDKPLAGRVRRIEPSAFTRLSALGVEEQRVNVLIAITAPRSDWAALGDGYRVQVRLVLWRGEEVLKLPQGAVFRYQGGWAVYRVAEGRAVRVPVRVGHRGETEVEVTSGLELGALVSVHPGDRVKDGVRVEARK